MKKCETCKEEYIDDEIHVCKTSPAEKAGFTSVADSDLKTFVADMPQVVEDAVQAAEDKEKSKQEVWQKTVDNKGRKFDPALYEYDEKTGEPIKTPTGRFKRKLKVPKEAQAQAQQAQQAADPLMIEAQQYTDTINLFARGLIGDEANFNPGERDAHVAAWYGVFLRYGSIPINPLVGLGMVYIGFVSSRASLPRTKTFLQAAGDKIKSSMSWFFGLIFRKPQKGGKDGKPNQDTSKSQ